MTSQKHKYYRKALEELAHRTGITSNSLEEATRTGTGGESAGNLSNTPMHLGDIGSEAYTQELNATLLENEESIRQDINDALDKLDGESFGICEECGKRIPQKRLDAVPYARRCMKCEEKSDVIATSMNTGRLPGWGSTFEHPAALAARKRSGEQSPFNAPRTKADSIDDPHAAGTPGGGSAIGGLAGTNIGEGEPEDTLDEAMGSGHFDNMVDADEAAPDDGYAGHSGGAVGGTPANKRARGGNVSRSHTATVKKQ